MADANIGKSAAKVFFGCFDAPTHFEFRSFSPSVGASKHPKNTFAACFLVVNLYFASHIVKTTLYVEDDR